MERRPPKLRLYQTYRSPKPCSTFFSFTGSKITALQRLNPKKYSECALLFTFEECTFEGGRFSDLAV